MGCSYSNYASLRCFESTLVRTLHVSAFAGEIFLCRITLGISLLLTMASFGLFLLTCPSSTGLVDRVVMGRDYDQYRPRGQRNGLVEALSSTRYPFLEGGAGSD